MGAACGCMDAKSKGESRNGRNIVNNKGGVMIGGSNEVVDDVAAARAAKFGKKREEANNPVVLAGKALFYQSGCADCHQPSYTTSEKANVEQAGQRIWPYTDLLLHNMGRNLADHRPEFLATGYEWRTPPLWGIGLTQTVNKHTFFLHDGRARNLLEAIIWHGGEAQKAQQKVVNMTPEERHLLIQFLESL
jgi:CxxC motif-containing protein (DUF1111 family)